MTCLEHLPRLELAEDDGLAQEVSEVPVREVPELLGKLAYGPVALHRLMDRSRVAALRSLEEAYVPAFSGMAEKATEEEFTVVDQEGHVIGGICNRLPNLLRQSRGDTLVGVHHQDPVGRGLRDREVALVCEGVERPDVDLVGELSRYRLGCVGLVDHQAGIAG